MIILSGFITMGETFHITQKIQSQEILQLRFLSGCESMTSVRSSRTHLVSCGDVIMPEDEKPYIYYNKALWLQGVNQSL